MSIYDRRLADMLQAHYGFIEPDLRPSLRSFRPLPLPPGCSDTEHMNAYDLYCASLDSLVLGRSLLSAYERHPRMRTVTRWLRFLQGLQAKEKPAERPRPYGAFSHRPEWWALRAFDPENPEKHRIDAGQWRVLENVFLHADHGYPHELPAFPLLQGAADFAWFPGGLRAFALCCWPQPADRWDDLWRIGSAELEDLPLIAQEPGDWLCEWYCTQRLHGYCP